MDADGPPGGFDGPLVTDEHRALIGRDSPPTALGFDRERIPLILAGVGEPLLALGRFFPPWLLVGLGLGFDPFTPNLALLPAGALVQVEWRFFGRVPMDQPLRAVSRVEDIRDRVGGRYGHTVLITSSTDVLVPGGEVVARFSVSRIQFKPPGGPLPAPTHAPPRPAGDGGGSPAEAMAPPPLHRPRRFAEVTVGERLGPRPYTPTAATVDAFLPRFRVPLQSQSSDLDAARERGYEGVVVPTSAQMCLVAKLVSDWAGDPFAVRVVRGAFREADYLGRPLAIHGEVVHARVEGGEGIADIEGGAYSPGRHSIRASIQVALPP